MARKLKATGFARFFIVMLFVVPIAYLIASYANGEDGMGNIKNILGVGTSSAAATTVEEGSEDDCRELLQQLEAKEQRIQKLERENAQLRSEQQ